MIKALYIHRKNLFDYGGGEQDQIRNTKNAMEKLGVEITLTDSLPSNPNNYDIIHFFGLDPFHISAIKLSKGIPKVLSPVFWDKSLGYPLDAEYEEWPRPGHRIHDKLSYLIWRMSGLHAQRVANIARIHFYESLRKFASFQSVIDDIDMFLPNSEAEINSLRNFYVIENCKYTVIPNAINIDALNNPSDYAQRNLPTDKPFVCCSAGIDRRKNQYFLAKAMLDIDAPLVFAGGVRDKRYFETVRKVALRRKDVYFLGHLKQQDLHSVYKAASVHVLPSFYDTPGISNLEAVAHECNNVSTQVGGLREYLGEHSLYCNPFNVEHIGKQIKMALELPPNLEGSKLVREKYTYEKVASATLKAYKSLLNA